MGTHIDTNINLALHCRFVDGGIFIEEGVEDRENTYVGMMGHTSVLELCVKSHI